MSLRRTYIILEQFNILRSCTAGGFRPSTISTTTDVLQWCACWWCAVWKLRSRFSSEGMPQNGFRGHTSVVSVLSRRLARSPQGTFATSYNRPSNVLRRHTSRFGCTQVYASATARWLPRPYIDDLNRQLMKSRTSSVVQTDTTQWPFTDIPILIFCT